jgi:error-prone DNA polymerase
MIFSVSSGTLEPTNGGFHAVRLGFCMVRSLNQKDAEQLVDRRTFGRIAASRASKAFATIEEVWRRADIPVSMLRNIAAADGFAGMGLSRREANWAIKALRDEALPLFAAADDRAGELRPEAIEPTVTLAPMTTGREVVEDYRAIGLSLRAHPLGFLRDRLAERGYAPCCTLRTTSNGLRATIAGLVLVRQMPGSAKGVMFISLEDESANANIIVWPSIFEKNRRAILAASLLGCAGKVQNANGVIHLVVDQVVDLTAEMKRISGLDAAFPRKAGRGDEAKHGGSGLDSREPKHPIIQPRDMYTPDLHIDTIKLKLRNFR